MLVRQGEERNNDVDQRLACLLAAAAGALNAAAFHAVGFFSANMTGNVSSLSDHLARGDLKIGALFLAIVVVFIAGSATSTLIVNAGRRRNVRAIYAYSILAEATLLTLLGLTAVSSAANHGPTLVLGLSFLMGLQNAVVTRISSARVRTTHVSGMVTDIGIELGMLLDISRRREPEAFRSDYRSKLVLHGATVLAFLGGGVAGVVSYQTVGNFTLFAVAAMLFWISFAGIRDARRLKVSAG